MNKYVIKNATWENITIIFLLAVIVLLISMRSADLQLKEKQLWECINGGKSWNDQFEISYESYRSTDTDDITFVEVLNRFE
jgi:hypothetical protein